MFSFLGKLVESIWEAVWYIGKELLKGPETPSVTDPADPPKPIKTPDTSPRLFALTIGINEYKYARSPALPNLSGCVADAEAVVDYLNAKLLVPKDQIISLRDARATRANIIQSIRNLTNDARIEKGDAILIFYAGHGAEALAPKGWPAFGNSSKIQMILPHDFYPGTSEEPEQQGIFDLTLSGLLTQLAEVKGDNITVIFDSCNSGSGTRTAATKASTPTRSVFNVRGAELPFDYKILSSADHEIRQHIANTRMASTSESDVSGLYSHVLLAGCSARGVSLEDPILKRGAFTSALLRLLERVSPDNLTYRETIDRLETLPDKQFPQCEGFNQGRILFDNKAAKATRLIFRVLKQDGSFILEAGEAQGLAPGAKFDLFESKDIGAPLFGRSAIRGNPRACTSTLQDPILPDGSKAQRSKVPNILWALQTHVGADVSRIAIGLPLDEDFVPLIRRIVLSMDEQRPTKRNIELVDIERPHELRLRKTGSKDVIFDINDPQVNGFGVKSIVHSVPVGDDERLFLVLSRAADFYHHFRRSAKPSTLAQNISLEAFRLSQQSVSGQSEWLPTSPQKNLNVDGVMMVDVTARESFGFRIVNNGPDPLYVWAFFFEMSDLSINPVYQPTFAKANDSEGGTSTDPSVYPNGELTIGYGSGGARRQGFKISDDDLDVEVTYMKVFVTTRPVDLSYIAQASPFPLLRKGVPLDDPPKDDWDTMTMAIIVKRGFDD